MRRFPRYAAALVTAVLGVSVSAAPAGTWKPIPQATVRPLARSKHTLTSYQGTAVLYGGLTPDLAGGNPIALDDLWQYTAATGLFSRLNSSTPLPPERYSHASTAQGVRFYTFFGLGSDGQARDDAYYYDFPGTCWVSLTPNSTDRPSPRSQHSVVTVDDEHILVFGGRAADGITLLDDVWDFTTAFRIWTPKAAFPGGGRCGHCAVFLGGRMYVLGGSSVLGPQNDVWMYDPAGDQWSALTSDGDVPAPFTGAAASVGDFDGTGSPEILVVGGQDANGTDLGGTYSVTVNPATLAAHWTRRADHSGIFESAAAAITPTVASGSAVNLLLFGGSANGVPTDTGSIFSAGSVVFPGPDLTAKWLSLTAKPKGKGAKVRWTLTGSVQLQNVGTAVAGTSTLTVLLSPDGTPHPADPVLNQFKMPLLVPGGSRTVKVSATLPKGVSVFGRYAVAVADSAGGVRESNETNNTAKVGPLP